MKESNTTFPGVIALLSLCGALACGDDGGSSGSGVSGDKLLSDATDAEAKKVCEWMEKQASSIDVSTKQACTAVALGFSSSEDECSEIVDQCVSSGEVDEEDGADEDDCDDVDADLANACDTVTVADLETCVKAYVNAFERELASLSCADAGEEVDFGATLPAACDKIEEECPELLADLEDEEEAG